MRTLILPALIALSAALAAPAAADDFVFHYYADELSSDNVDALYRRLAEEAAENCAAQPAAARAACEEKLVQRVVDSIDSHRLYRRHALTAA